jgi:hypothetical protein
LKQTTHSQRATTQWQIQGFSQMHRGCSGCCEQIHAICLTNSLSEGTFAQHAAALTGTSARAFIQSATAACILRIAILSYIYSLHWVRKIVLQMMPPQPFGSFDDLVSDNTAALQADTWALTGYTAAASVNLSKTAVATGPWQASYCSQNSRIHTTSIDAIPRTAYHQSPPAASSLSTPTCESGFQGYCGGQLGYSGSMNATDNAPVFVLVRTLVRNVVMKKGKVQAGIEQEVAAMPEQSGSVALSLPHILLKIKEVQPNTGM